MENIELHKEKVNQELKKFLEIKLTKDKDYSNEIKELIKNIIEFNLREAKRIRPLIAIFSYKCFKDDEKIVPVSISLELLQAYLLIHDDIMDNSDLRRGKPAFHKIYEKIYNKTLGKSIAILAGNLCASYAYDSIIESDFTDQEKIMAVKYISWIINRENYGQTLDLLPGFENISEEDILKIYELKTATYTIQGPIYLGSILANAPKEKIKKLQDYAYNLGLAFQLQDDLNSVFGESNKTGKPSDSDIKEGKKTLIIAKTLELCKKEDKEFLLKEYGNEKITKESMSKIKSIMINSKALNYCADKLGELIANSKESIKDLELNPEGKNYLLEMAEYIKGLYKI